VASSSHFNGGGGVLIEADFSGITYYFFRICIGHYAENFSSNLFVQTGSGAHPASCTMGTGGPFPGGKSAAGACR